MPFQLLFDWRKSGAHRLLLSKFLRPNTAERYSRSDEWAAVLKENPQKAIRRFVDDGMLAEVDLRTQLDRNYTATQIRGLLEQRGLPGSGRKQELIQRLIEADPKGARKAATGPPQLQCTEKGRDLAERYLADQRAERQEVEQHVLEFLRQRKFREASMAVASFEAKQVFPRGMNVDWKDYDPRHDISILSHIFDGKPKALKQADDVRLDPFRLAAAMFHLCGPNRGNGWLPSGVSLGLRWDDERVVDMILGYGVFRANVEEYRQMGVKWVRILGCNDDLVCPACRKLQSRTFRLRDVPELPYERCTSESGCRCAISAKVDPSPLTKEEEALAQMVRIELSDGP